MKIVAIGDPHITNNFDDFDKVLSKALEQSPDLIVILGDLFHTHSTIKADVLHYWVKTIKELSRRVKVAILRGNHDAPHDRSSYNKMGPVKFLSEIEWGPNVIVANEPIAFNMSNANLLLLPFFYEEEDLNKAVESLDLQSSVDYVFCHQTFDGGKYDNGFYAPDAFSGDFLKSKLSNEGLIISGHLHSRQELGKVIYVGSPLWLSRSDTDSDKFILLIDTETKELRWIDMSSVVERPVSVIIKSIQDVDSLVGKMQGRHTNDLFVTIQSSAEEVSAIKKSLLNAFPHAKIKIVPTNTTQKRNKVYKAQDLFSWLKERASQEEYEVLVSYLNQTMWGVHGKQ